MLLRPPRSTRTYPLFPYTPLCRSVGETANRWEEKWCSAGPSIADCGADEVWVFISAHLTAKVAPAQGRAPRGTRSEEHTSELQSLMRISYAVFCLKKKKKTNNIS